VTDPGVEGKQNQDDFFLWQSPDGQTLIAAVLDGHGRELGQVRPHEHEPGFERGNESQ
jgi:serine/threonine protein phosphatase PrpC